MEIDATRMCELLVGLPAVSVLGVGELPSGGLLTAIESRATRPACPTCAEPAHIKERPAVELVDVPVFGRPTRLQWRKHRWSCLQRSCPMGSRMAQDPRIAHRRMGLSDRAGRWATEQVGRCGRSVREPAAELGCDWHTVNDAVSAYGDALLAADEDRIQGVIALGLEPLSLRRHQHPGQTPDQRDLQLRAEGNP